MTDTSGEVEIAPGVVGPRALSSELTGSQDVRMAIRFDDDRARYVCEELVVRRRAGGAPVTTEVVREIQIGQRISLQLLALTPIRDLPNPDGREPWGRQVPDDVAKGGPTDRALQWVAHMYRVAYALHYPPTRAVEETVGLPRATAGRWISTARKKGLLGPAQAGKAGG